MAKEAFDRQKRSLGAAAPKPIAQHTVAAGDTLAAIAQKHYGSSAQEKWMAIYNANKATIGDNPSAIKVGQVLNIPKLTEA